MESLSTAELVALAQTSAEISGLQYQYWLAITFATIVASFVARNLLPFKLKIAVACLYSMASVLFLLIYINVLDSYTFYAIEAMTRGAMPTPTLGLAIPVLRFLIWIAGTGVTIWFVFQNQDQDAV